MGEMTDLLSRPLLRVPTQAPTKRRPTLLVAVLASGAVAVGGLLLCLGIASAGWFAADTGTFSQGLRVGALAWLVVHGSGLDGTGWTVGLVPLGLWLVAALALGRTARWVAADPSTTRPRRAFGVVALMTLTYTAVGVAVALLASVDGIRAPLPRAVGAIAVTALLSTGVGVLRGSGQGARLAERLPVWVRGSMRGGAAGVLVMVLAGALLFLASILVHVSIALRLAEGLEAGVVGGSILALVCAALVPNAALWAGSFAAGPGFTVGAGSHVAPSGTHVGLMPDVPLLAAVPQATGAWWMTALIAVPVLAGALAGLVSTRRHPVFGVDAAAVRGAAAGLLGGAAFGLLTAASGGAAGPGRLAHVGPDVLATTAICAIAGLLGGAVGAATGRLVGAWLDARGGIQIDPFATARRAIRNKAVPPAGGAEPAESVTFSPTTFSPTTPLATGPKTAPIVDPDATQPVPIAPPGD